MNTTQFFNIYRKHLKFEIVNKKISQKISKKIKLAECISPDKKKRY